LQPLSPFVIGSGQEYNSDIDIVLDSLGRPYIPGTSVAGLLRSFANDPVELFGNVTINTSDDAKEGEKVKAIPSKVFVYDGLLAENVNGSVDIRDNVALNEWKVVEGKAKFDYEICDTADVFTSYLEVDKNNYTDTIESEIEKLLTRFLSYEYGLGGKTSRGFGRFGLTVYKKTFTWPVDISDWLKFDMFAEADWADKDRISLDKENIRYTVLKVPLELCGGISIRRYTAEVGENVPDYEHLKCQGKPVIPGTSWSGAFRSRINEFLKGVKDVDTERWFGKLGEKSLIVFEESEIVGGSSKTISRNSIDRFSAATKERSLYTERTHWGGTTELTIRFPSEFTDQKFLLIKPLIWSCVLDLIEGMLPVGGLVSVGRGVFKLKPGEKITLNGEKKDLDVLEKEMHLRREKITPYEEKKEFDTLEKEVCIERV